ncbi:MAG: hypothetical protein HKP10_07235 [Kiritimatiellales bacterium]|nr:hypothetical protein [Kiritimatiellales bacterium]
MQQTSLNIGTIGQKLESARQAKGVTVSEAGQATKILSKFIEAMESDDFGALSAPVYAKSFIRMYARYLGLDDRPLVEEYLAQHAPKAKSQLSDEVRQNIAQADHAPAENGNGGPTAMAKAKAKGSSVFGDVNDAIARLSGSGLSLKIILPVVAGVLMLAIIIFSVTQCADDEAEAPAAGGAASVQREVIMEGVPDAYLVKPGVVHVDR